MRTTGANRLASALWSARPAEAAPHEHRATTATATAAVRRRVNIIGATTRLETRHLKGVLHHPERMTPYCCGLSPTPHLEVPVDQVRRRLQRCAPPGGRRHRGPGQAQAARADAPAFSNAVGPARGRSVKGIVETASIDALR